MSKQVWWGVVCVAAIGCVSEGRLIGDLAAPRVANLPELGPETHTDVIVQAVVPQVDVLWTIDNSGSMDDEQQALIDSFAAFMQYFLGSGLDYHIGVVSTDMVDPAHGGALQSGGTPHHFIDVDTPDAVGVFTAMASLGAGGSSWECGLEATFAALETLRDTVNAGFRRDEAALHTVVVSDEADNTDPAVLTVDEFVTWYDGLPRSPEDGTFSGIVDAATGEDYLAVTGAVGGIGWSITDTAYTQVLDQLGIQATGLGREFFLSQWPVPDTISVSVEDVGSETVTFFDTAWTYDPVRNSVTFGSYVPGELARIVLHYQVMATTALTNH